MSAPFTGLDYYRPEEVADYMDNEHSWPLETCKHPGCVRTREIEKARAEGDWERVRKLCEDVLGPTEPMFYVEDES